MNFMFQACVKLTGLNLSKWDVSKVVTMSGMFQSVGSIGKMMLTTIGDTTNWDTSSCTDMKSMFQLCSNLQFINAENWDVSKVVTMQTMFHTCTSLTSIGNTANWNTASCTTMAEMFRDCASLKELNLSNFDTSNVVNMPLMFDGLTALKKITLRETLSFNGNGASDAAVLPTPPADNIPLADGNWYDHDYNAYAPADVPSKVARTYYASKLIAAGDDDTMVFVKNGTLRQIAVALRHKTGKSDTMHPSEFAEEVLAL
jgi:surface protein